MKKLLLVVAATLFRDGRVLLAQRPEGKNMAGLWELPGGKLERGEEPEAALIRELHEELGIVVKDSDLTPLNFASHAYSDFHILMPVYACRQWTGEIDPREGQAIAWVSPADLADYPAPAADIPLFKFLAEYLEME